jgi:hypothetical protein
VTDVEGTYCSFVGERFDCVGVDETLFIALEEILKSQFGYGGHLPLKLLEEV